MKKLTTWKKINDWPWYEVSDTGEVRSLPRKYVPHGKVLKQYPGSDDYPMVSLNYHRRHKTMKVHVLVASAFLGERPEGADVRHLDGDKWNNDVQNLSYGTRKENISDTLRLGRHYQKNKTHCPQGHPYDEINTYLTRNGKRMCRACCRNRARENIRRKRKAVTRVE